MSYENNTPDQPGAPPGDVSQLINESEVIDFAANGASETFAEQFAIEKSKILFPGRMDQTDVETISTFGTAIAQRMQQVSRRWLATDVHVVDTVPSKNQRRFIDDFVFGPALLIVAAAFLMIVPGYSALLAYESAKIETLSEFPFLALLLGAPALGGLFSILLCSSTISTDAGKRRFSFWLGISTVVVFSLWALLASDSAYPIADLAEWFGTSEPESIGGLRAAQPDGLPLGFMLTVSLLLEALGGACLHQLARQKLQHKTSKEVRSDEESQSLVSEAESLLDEAQHVGRLRSAASNHPDNLEANRSAFVLAFMAKFRFERMRYRAIGDKAIVDAYEEEAAKVSTPPAPNTDPKIIPLYPSKLASGSK